MPSDARRHCLILLPVVVLRPAVEPPIGDGYLVACIADKDRSVVACPYPIGWANEELDCVEIGADLFQNSPSRFLLFAVLHQYAHALDSRQFADDFSIDPRNGREAARPIVAIVGPCD